MHHLNIKPDTEPVKQQWWQFWPHIMAAMKSKFTNSLNVASFERDNTQTGLLTLCLFLKRTTRSESALTLTYSRDEFSLHITDIMIDNTCGFKRISFMDGFSGYNQIKMYLDDEKHMSLRTPLGYTMTRWCHSISRTHVQSTNMQ